MTSTPSATSARLADASDDEDYFSAEEDVAPPAKGGFDSDAVFEAPATSSASAAPGLDAAFERVFDDAENDSESEEEDSRVRDVFAPDVGTEIGREQAADDGDKMDSHKAMNEELNRPTNDSETSDSEESAAEQPAGADDDESPEQIEEILSPAETQRLLAESLALKEQGNSHFARGEFDEAMASYEKALEVCPKTCKEERAVYHANAAACLMKLEKWKEAVKACDRGGLSYVLHNLSLAHSSGSRTFPTALADNPLYTKALHRRAQCLEKQNTAASLEKALEDYRALLTREPSNRTYSALVSTLPKRIAEVQAKERDEMLGKLKELGNGLLGRFGLSTDNFQFVKDPATGSYSVNFTR